MPDFLKNASAWLDATLAESDGETVRYARGIPHVDLTAVPGQTPVGFDLGSVLQTWQTQDFLFATTDLILSGHASPPEVGDEITYDDNVYRVCNATDGRCYRFTDTYRQTMRVHTKEA
jgi:hypothetical protein